MANWSQLPSEVKAMVVEEFALSSPEWLPELRQVDREMKLLTDAHFGAFFFKEIILFNSEYAAKRFKDMCESRAIGPAIEKVILSAIRIQPDGCNRWLERLPVIESHGVETGLDVQEDLTTAFSTLRSYGKPITIGISVEFSDENDRMLGYTHKMQNGDFSYMNVAADEVDAFDTITDAAKDAGCQVQGLEVKLYPRPGCPRIDLAWGYYGFPSTLEHYLRRNPKMNVHIETQIGEKSQKAINVMYEREPRRLSIKNSRTSALSSTWRLGSWIKKIELEQIHIGDMKIKAAAFQSLVKSHVKDIKKIELRNCGFLSDRNLEATLKFVSTLTALDECLIVTPRIKGSFSALTQFLTVDNIDDSIKYTGNVAEQITGKLEFWEGLNNQNDNESEEDESEEEESDEDENGDDEDSEEEEPEEESDGETSDEDEDTSEEESEITEDDEEESDQDLEERDDRHDGDYHPEKEDEDGD
jgi:hypothetical protein